MLRFISLFFILLNFSAFAQDRDVSEPMRVVHCTAIDQTSEVKNIFILEDGRPLVTTNKGTYTINSADNAKLSIRSKGHWALPDYPGGNANLYFTARSLIDTSGTNPEKIHLTKGNVVTTTFFDENQKKLWIGTSLSGVYSFKVKTPNTTAGPPVLLESYNADNSKLKSNHINNIMTDRYGRTWVGTKRGVLMIKDGKNRLEESGSNISAIDAIGTDVWILADDILYMVNEKNRWFDGDLVGNVATGTVRDIEFDNDARMWVASETISRYNVEDNLAVTFGRGDGFTGKKVTCLKIDKENGLWIGTAGQGLFLIEKEKMMTVSCLVEKALSCDGKKNDAVLLAKAIGGTAPYKFKWSNKKEGEKISGLGHGTYTVTISDSGGQVRQVSAVVANPNMTLVVDRLRGASGSKASDGSATVEVQGGTPDYRFEWDNGEVTATAKILPPGAHSVTVTDKVGCASVSIVMVGHDPDPEIPALAVNIEQVGGNKCPDDKSVSINLTVEGGMGPYAFVWNNSSLNGANVKSLGAGKYAVTVSDASGDSVVETITVTAGEGMSLETIQMSAATRAGARDGQARVNVRGGAGALTFFWDNNESRARAIRLTPGRHNVTVTDANGCQAVSSVSISTKKIPELDANTLTAGQTIRLENLYFEADSTRITERSKPVLDEVYAFLEGNPKIIVEIGGHTNNIPSHEYCDQLSSARARSIADYIVLKGVDASRVVSKGYGKRKPIASNETTVGRRKNQRVEIKILSTNG